MLRAAVARLEEGLLALILAAMTLLTFLQVVLRYGFNTGLLWALEATVYMFGWLILLGISYGVRTRAHLGVDIAVKALPAGPRKVAGLLAISLCVLFAGLMLYGSYKYEYRMFQLGVAALDIPVDRWIVSLCLPIGFALLLLRLLVQAWSILSGRAAGLDLADEASETLAALRTGETDQAGKDDRASRS
jgi:C4-dicarboxylate transporter DctQ subunit